MSHRNNRENASQGEDNTHEKTNHRQPEEKAGYIEPASFENSG
jgi:hypothetical protein